MARPFFTYILRCSDESYYVGHTDDLENRVASHETGRYSRLYGIAPPGDACLVTGLPTREEALTAERRIKNWSRAKKEALIRGDYTGLSEAAKKIDWAGYRVRKRKLH